MTDRSSETAAGRSGLVAPPLAVSVRNEGSATTVIEVRGELDIATAPVLKQHLEGYSDLAKSNVHLRRIVYLLTDLKFMDSSGLHCILTAVAGHDPATITVREPSSQVRRLFELVGLESMIEGTANR